MMLIAAPHSLCSKDYLGGFILPLNSHMLGLQAGVIILALPDTRD